VPRLITGVLPTSVLAMVACLQSAPAPVRAQAGSQAWRPQTAPLFGVSYSPGIGLVIGAGVIHTRYGFRALPPSARLRAEGAYATGARTYRVDLAAELRRPGPPTVFNVELHASGLDFTRFYGAGNESDGSQPDSVYRVRQEQFLLLPTVTIPLAPRLRLTAGPSLKYSHTRDDPGTFLATTGPYYGTGDFGEVGARTQLDFDTRDHPAAAARGGRVTVAGQWYPALWNVADPFARIQAEASTYLSTGDPAFATLALRAAGAAVSGSAPFQELVYLGGGSTIRGYAEQRFAGRRGAYANVELRLLAGRPSIGDIGIFGLADAGRVWTPGPSSERWHAAAGGGLWFAWQHRRDNTLSLAAAKSPEQTGIYVRMGFLF
jgi:outer membrane protein assembly factor BamA